MKRIAQTATHTHVHMYVPMYLWGIEGYHEREYVVGAVVRGA